jgi:uncharacterized protein (TIGR02145 family)
MKNIFLVLGCFIISLSISAQDSMFVHRKDGSILNFAINNIDSIIFYPATGISSSSVTDTEGNVYNTIVIGTQEWMAENLKTTKFNDGASITLMTNNQDWYNTVNPAYSWYDNDEATNKNKYGALYNGYAVSTGKLCPTGWRVPSDDDWKILEDYLIANGHSSDGTTTGRSIGKSLASITGWKTSSGLGHVGSTLLPEYRNKSGFNGFPGGRRDQAGTFANAGDFAYWWTSTKNSEASFIFKYLSYYYSTLETFMQNPNYGFSVRCVKN